MNDFPLRSPDQLTAMLQALRKSAHLTQSDLAARMGLTQQNLSEIENNPGRMSVTRFMKLLGSMGAEIVIRTGPGPGPGVETDTSPGTNQPPAPQAKPSPSDTPNW